ncbi:MAG: MBL fold metallo-hydrolase [Duncaniella sp.]|nr:MBL fold metallo-hydrolase [Duncaniella sp.]
MNVSRFTVNPFGENTYVLWDADSREAAVIDPGMSNEAEREALDKFIEREKLTPVHLVNTHQHIDHCLGNQHIRTRYGLKLEANEGDDFLGQTLTEQSRRFGMRVTAENAASEVHLADGDRLYVGKEPVEVIAVPGHSPGSIALYAPESGFVITGDALFPGSIGRTDLPGGSHSTLVNSIRTRLFTLPDDTVVLPGHGGETTIGIEKLSNPYL